MKRLVLGIIFIASSLTSFAQKSFDDLKILYADGNYEKLVREAEKYCNNDEYKKDPMPHLWMAKGLYKISVTGNDDPVYKNAYKDALGALSKFIKNDKSGEAMSDPDNAEFVDMMQKTLMEQIDNELATDNYRKAYSWIIKYKKISNNLIGQMYLEGASKFKTDDRSSAFTLWKDAESALSKVTSTQDWSETDMKMLRIGALKSAECLVSVKQVEKAKALLNKVAPWFEGDEDFKEAYDAIVN